MTATAEPAVIKYIDHLIGLISMSYTTYPKGLYENNALHYVPVVDNDYKSMYYALSGSRI